MSVSSYEPGGVVWVKCGSHYWPGEVKAFDDLPSHVKKDFDPSEDRPECIVKFFDEDGYEFLEDTKGLFPYNCEKKEDFIKKGLVKSRRTSKEGSSWFAKFPKDIVRCEILTQGDPQILEKEPFLERNEKVNYKEIFGSHDSSSSTGSNSSPASKRRKRTSNNAGAATPPSKRPKESPKRPPISHPRFKPGASGASDHKVKILPQPSSPYHLDLAVKQERAAASSSGSNYTCSICGFAASRLNVIILHNKSHSSGAAAGGGGSRSSGSPGRGGATASPRTTATPKKTSRKSLSSSPSPVKTKAPRVSKKIKEQKAKQQEDEKKNERRNKILDDWSDDGEEEEDDEEEKRMQEESSRPKRAVSDDEEMEGFMGDDHLRQEDYSDDELIETDEQTSPHKDSNGRGTHEKDVKANILEEEMDQETASPLSGAHLVDSSNKNESSNGSSPHHQKEESSPSKGEDVINGSSDERLSSLEKKEEPHKGSNWSPVKEDGPSSPLSKDTSKSCSSSSSNGSSAILEDESPSSASKKEEEDSICNSRSDSVVDDINKVLEETRVPSLPSDIPKKSRMGDPWTLQDEIMREEEDSKKEKGETSKSEEGLLQGAGSDATYILLVDDGSGAVDSLNSQTLYIDPNSLASGDLSNMVLMTSSSGGSNNGGLEGAQAPKNKDILALAIQQQQAHQVVTTVDTTGGVAIVPGIASSSSVSKVPLISTKATPPGPLMTPEVLPSQLPPPTNNSLITSSKK